MAQHDSSDTSSNHTLVANALTANPLPTRTLSFGKRLELIWLKAWQQQAWWLWLFLPLSWLYGGVIRLKKWRYANGGESVYNSGQQVYHAPVPVLVVGNITVGGSGKTPLIAELVYYLQEQGIKVGVISRGYGGDETIMPCLVNRGSTPQTVGDEPSMLVRQTDVPMVVCPNRQLAIECLLKHYADVQLIIADDGLQHYKLHRDIEWVVVDSHRGFGNQQLLPTGFLREPIHRLNDASIIWHGEPKQSSVIAVAHDMGLSTSCVMTLQPDTVYPLIDPPNYHKSLPQPPLTVYAVSGIGYPERFFATLRTLGYTVLDVPMPDHHEFASTDLLDLTQHPIIITEKDAVKIAPLVAANPSLQILDIWVLPVRAVLSKACYDLLDRQLNAVGIR